MIREGRLGKGFNAEAASFSSSLNFDISLFEYDILTNIAHAVMLYEQKLLEEADAKKILSALKDLEKKGVKSLQLDPELEDIHIAIESQIIQQIGDAGGRLHTARSRNDQVACDLRMKAKDDTLLLSKALIGLIISLLEVAEKNTLTIMPAYTHLQHAQPTTLAHHLMSYVDSLLRTLNRLWDSYPRIDLSPLGSRV
jgi:argininosuccinate lyase